MKFYSISLPLLIICLMIIGVFLVNCSTKSQSQQKEWTPKNIYESIDKANKRNY